MEMLRRRWARSSLVTRVTLWYTLLLASVVVVVGVVMAGSLSRWIEENTLNRLSTQGQELRLALTAAAQTDQPFQASAMRLLNEAAGRDVQASVWAEDGRLIARSDGFYFPQENRSLSVPDAAVGIRVATLPCPISQPCPALPSQPALASGELIAQFSDRLYLNTSTASGSVSARGASRVALLIIPLDGVPDNLVATSDAYPDVPPLRLPTPD